MKRSTRVELARQTVRIVDVGCYDLPDGRAVDIRAAVQACLAATRFIPPEELKRLRREALARPAENETAIEVRNETTLAGIARLVADGCGGVAALNFASARNPGGGFLNGSEAQEESLARSSALYASLLRGFDYYARHRAEPSCLYSDAMILSPDCPVIRDDTGRLLERPHTATFLTSAAPNAGAIARNAPDELPLIPEVLGRRAECVLALAAGHGCRHLVLGAWGCGVFRNDPDTVARTFAAHLRGAWAGRFRRVAFSVLDTSAGQQTVEAFRRAFA